ncbi:acyltransferase [Clostridium sp. UBA1652]|uniref:acyltransferase n=1 Tax=Clostridium sp. UBA1652 TaxID=1946348 RepID=UPI00257FD399|nr:N-acetyltransferase [Clostridium sp. UBA1652]
MSGKNCSISKSSVIKEGVIIGDNVIIEDGVYIDYYCIIRDNVHIKKNTFIGARSILGEYLYDFYEEKINKNHKLIIGENSLIRTENVIYGDCKIGDGFQTGHKVTIRENTIIGKNVRIGTLSDIQGHCQIGNYVSLHSNVHIGQKSVIKDFVWIFPYVVLTNDPTPPSDNIKGCTIEEFALITTNSVLLPGVTVHREGMVGAGSVVSRDVEEKSVVVGRPAKKVCDLTDIKDKETGKDIYPWRYTFDRGMPWEKIGFDNWLNTTNYESLIDYKK